MKYSSRLIFIVGLIILLLAGCSESATTESDSASASGSADKLLIAVTNMTMKESVYHFMKAGAEAKAKELGVDLVWQSSENDPPIQLNQVQDFVSQGADVIAIEPARSDAAQSLVKLAQDSEIPVINIGAKIQGIKTDLRIDNDNYIIGKNQVEDFAKIWGDKPANVVVLSGTKGDELAERISEGVLDTLKEYPQYSVVSHQAHMNWDRSLAMNTMENALTKFNNEITVVFANNDTMAHGAIKAAENAGVADNILFYGADADQDSIEWMLKGKENLKVIDRDSYLQGTRIVEAAVALANDKPIPEAVESEDNIPFWVTPTQMIGKENVEIMKEKFPESFK